MISSTVDIHYDTLLRDEIMKNQEGTRNDCRHEHDHHYYSGDYHYYHY